MLGALTLNKAAGTALPLARLGLQVCMVKRPVSQRYSDAPMESVFAQFEIVREWRVQ